MSLIFYDSFKNYTFLPLKWDERTKDCQFYITDGIGRKGGQALRVYSDYTDINYDFLGKNLNGNYEEVIIGFAFKKVKEDIGFIEIDFNDGGSTQSKIKLFNANFIWYNADESISYGLNNCLTLNDWNYVEAKIKTNAVSGSIHIKVNEFTAVLKTGVNTTTTENDYVNEVRLKLRHYADTNEDYAYIDDLYIANTLGASCNDFLGNCEVSVLTPLSQGSYSQFELAPTYSGVENYTLIDEPIYQEDYTTYSETFLEDSGLDDGGDITRASNQYFSNTGTTTTNGQTFYINPVYPPTWVWFTFHNLSIPKNSKITSANMSLYRQTYTGLYNSTTNEQNVWAQKAGSNPTPITAINQAKYITRTNTVVTTPLATQLNNLEIGPVIQELVSRHDWQEENNTVQILVRYRYTNDNSGWIEISYRTYEWSNDPYNSNSPKLNISWQLPGGDNNEYINSSALEVKDTYNLNDLNNTSEIFAINHNIFSKREYDRVNTNDLALVPLVTVGGTSYSGVKFLPTDRFYSCNNLIEEKNPSTGLNWQSTELSLNEFGFVTTASG
jgi:hypothetical protein